MKSKAKITTRRGTKKRPLKEQEFIVLYRVAQAICIVFPAGLIVLITGMATWACFIAGFWVVFSSIRLNSLNKLMAQEYTKRGRR